jgi:formamidopyrimidine-DNA glycosylase
VSAASLGPVPELPEVESVRRQLAPELTGRRVVESWWDPHPHARLSDLDLLPGRRVDAVNRRGKFLICPLDPDPDGDELELVLHLGMTGSLRFAPTSTAAPDAGVSHVRVRVSLDDGRTLLFRDPRRFGRASVVPAGDYARVVPTLATIGPEPLASGFTLEGFRRELARRRAPVKALLLDQRVVAGIGNIYADEALWLARIHPASRDVGPRRAAVLHEAIREVLTAAIDREGTTFRDYQMVNGESGRNADFLRAYGQAGLPCVRCGTALRASLVAGRGTTHCPRCQRR